MLLEDPAVRAVVVVAPEGDGSGGRDGASTLAASRGRSRSRRRDRSQSLAGEPVLAAAGVHGSAFLDLLDSFPTLPSGKIDRKRLPAPVAALTRTDRSRRAPGDALEADLLATYARVLRNDTILDRRRLLPGAGRLFVAGRAAGAATATGSRGRDSRCLQPPDHRGAGRTPTALEGRGGRASARRPRPLRRQGRRSICRGGGDSRPARRSLCGRGGSAAGLFLVYAVIALPYFGTYFPTVAWRAGRISFASCVGLWLLVLTGPGRRLFLLSVAAKWILIGRYRPGAYPLWSWYYPRLAGTAGYQLISGSTYLAGTPLLAVYLRAMGAKVGRRPQLADLDGVLRRVQSAAHRRRHQHRRRHPNCSATGWKTAI